MTGTADEDDARGVGQVSEPVVDGRVVLVDEAVAAEHAAGLACFGRTRCLLERLGVASRSHGVNGRGVHGICLAEAVLGIDRVDRPFG